MSAAEQFVTKEEFEPMKADIQKLIIRVEVLTQDVHSLRLSLAAFVEAADARFDQLEARVDVLEPRFDKLEARFDKLEARFDKLEARFDKLEARFDKLEARFDALEKTVIDGNAALMSAILNLAPRTA
jgi:predicted nuclease with TOPRIM domain